MLSGAHIVIFSRNAEADRAFVRDVLGLPTIDAGGGWLISGLPPTEMAFHPGEPEGATSAELYLMCADIQTLLGRLREQQIEAEPVTDQSWGLATHIALPSGARLGIEQPRHLHPPRASGPD